MLLEALSIKLCIYSMHACCSLSELVLLEELEEVLDFETAILWHVCAMQCVAHSVQTELSSINNTNVTVSQSFVFGIHYYLPDSVRAQVSCDLGVVRSAKFAERCNRILLADLECDDWAS